MVGEKYRNAELIFTGLAGKYSPRPDLEIAAITSTGNSQWFVRRDGIRQNSEYTILILALSAV